MGKICKICKIDKDLQEYNKQVGGRCGVRAVCKICVGIKCRLYNSSKLKGRRKGPLLNSKEYREENKEKMKEYQKKYYSDNKEKMKEYQNGRYQNNKEYFQNYAKSYNRDRRLIDPLFKMIGNTRNLIKNSFLRKFTKKSKKTIDILGCDFDFFSNHLSNLFDENMNWDNYGIYWEIDHIEPISNAKSTDDIIKLNHYSNLRPLKKEDNRSKGNKW